MAFANCNSWEDIHSILVLLKKILLLNQNSIVDIYFHRTTVMIFLTFFFLFKFSMMDEETKEEIYIPQVPDNHKSYVQQEFITHQNAFTFNNQYARDVGLGQKIRTLRKLKKRKK